eukprot:COSAG01_NODE_3905_length_5559_cov_13.718498_1_plen_330_part_00
MTGSCGCSGRRWPMMLLTDLPDQLLISIFAVSGQLNSRDLARLECSTQRFHRCTAISSSAAAAARTRTAVERAAQLLLGARADSWRVRGRPGESSKYLLFLLECWVWPPAVLSSGAAHVLLVGTGPTGQERALWAFGSNNWQQLGCAEAPAGREDVGARPPRVVDLGDRGVFPPAVCVAAGSFHSAAVTEDGALWTWGRAGSGRLGHAGQDPADVTEPGATLPRRVTLMEAGEVGEVAAPAPAPTGAAAGAAVPQAATAPAVHWGGGGGCLGGALAAPAAAVRVAQVAAGASHTACLSDCGRLWTWGSGTQGEGLPPRCHAPRRAAQRL